MQVVQLPKEDKGTFCGIIQTQLSVSSCPLKKGSCMWKNRLHGKCAYTSEELTTDEFALRVGLPPIDSSTVNIIRSTLQYKIRTEMTE